MCIYAFQASHRNGSRVPSPDTLIDMVSTLAVPIRLLLLKNSSSTFTRIAHRHLLYQYPEESYHHACLRVVWTICKLFLFGSRLSRFSSRMADDDMVVSERKRERERERERESLLVAVDGAVYFAFLLCILSPLSLIYFATKRIYLATALLCVILVPPDSSGKAHS